MHIVVPLEVVLGRCELPGELIGYGPVPASMCREAMLDPTATFRRWVLSPLGELLDCAAVYKPSQQLTDKIIARDRTCRMPGCNRQACHGEIDHIVPYDGANTVETNLEALCCRHHHAKHDGGWHVTRRDDGTTSWTSPTGRRYEKPPDPYPSGTSADPPPTPAPEAEPGPEPEPEPGPEPEPAAAPEPDDDPPPF